MKAVTLNVSLTPELAAFVRQRMSQGGYASVSEVVRECLRDRQQQEIEAEVAALEAAMKDAPARDLTEDEFGDLLATQRQVRAQMRRERQRTKQ
jgi:putative addiction module CopG family antidote